MGLIKRIGIYRLIITLLTCGAIYCLYRKAKGVRGTSDHWIGCDWRTTFPQAFRPIDTPTSSAVKFVGDSSGELACRRHLENRFKASFPKQRPDFLRNPITNQQLELDCYNSSLRLAVEYQGEQHYKYIPYFHTTRDSFLNQKYRDKIKKELCLKNNVILIEVPYTVTDISSFLDSKLSEHGLV